MQQQKRGTMEMRLAGDDREFLLRVRGYCQDGMSQPEMAKHERTSLTAFRERVLKCGFRFETTIERELVRTGTNEPLSDLLARGELLAEALA